jgi:hypothetical protein
MLTFGNLDLILGSLALLDTLFDNLLHGGGDQVSDVHFRSPLQKEEETSRPAPGSSYHDHS